MLLRVLVPIHSAGPAVGEQIVVEAAGGSLEFGSPADEPNSSVVKLMSLV